MRTQILNGKSVELPKSWSDLISWLQAFDESCSTVLVFGALMKCSVWEVDQDRVTVVKSGNDKD